MKTERLINFVVRRNFIAIVLAVACVVISYQCYYFHNYNNFKVFIQAFPHLMHGQNLYLLYPAEYNDVYLYSPTFALLIAPFYYLPVFFSLLLWTAISCIFIYAAITMMPKMERQKRGAVFYIILLELVTSLQNTQTTVIVVSCTVLAFCCMERRSMAVAAFFIIFATFIKIYGLAAVMLFFIYPQKPKFVAWMLVWGLVFLLMPLIAISSDQLVAQYQNWYHQIADVHQGEDTGINPNLLKPALSVMQWLKIWFHLKIPALYVQATGLILLLLPLLRTRLYSSTRYRYFILASILIFCMIFNHIAESPSYIVAVMGVAVWFVWETKNVFVWVLFGLAFVFTIMVATDFFPEYIRHNYAIPYVWKAVPCILIWCWIQYKLLFETDLFNLKTTETKSIK